MTATTTLKPPDEWQGKSAHAFMLDALQARTELAERGREFLEDVLAAREEVARHGLVHDADEVFDYLDDLLEGRKAEAGMRELVLARGKSGDAALHNYDLVQDTLLVLAIRHQRESGFVHA